MIDPEFHDRPGTRLTLRAEFVWWYDPEDLDEFAAFESGQSEAVMRAARTVLAIDSETEAPEPYDARTEGLGRGADGPAIAVGLALATVGAGYALTWLDAAQRVARFWRWARKRQRPPVLSLGAVVMLATVDLHQRREDLSDVQLLWAGDITGLSEMGDTGYTGEDLFAVMFTSGPSLWVYIVDSVGQVVHFGDGRQFAHGLLRFEPGTGDELGPDTPAEPPNMLLNETPASDKRNPDEGFEVPGPPDSPASKP